VHSCTVRRQLDVYGRPSPVSLCSLRGPAGALDSDVYWPAQLCCVWLQDLEPTTNGPPITRTVARFIQAPAQDPLVCSSTRQCWLQLLVSCTVVPSALLWLYSEFGADYKRSDSTRLVSAMTCFVWLASNTAAKLCRLVLHMCIPIGLFTHSHWSSRTARVQFIPVNVLWTRLCHTVRPIQGLTAKILWYFLIISYHIISYQKFIVRPLLGEPRPYVHYKSQPNAKTPKKTQKWTNVKSLTKIVWFQQFSELDRISHGADVVRQSVPGGRTRLWERPVAELRAQPW